ncbi:hypothetical protein HanIR_Chr01g0025901 [Helianthus annuus]|nr:hypothetical protein HanIR_Chr01g0025901 [Helianthus annuus]
MGHANSSAASHQILREWRSMHQERASWEKYYECLSAEAKVFVQAQIKLQEEKAAFDKEKKSEEWGLQGLRNKLQASEELLAKERKEWRVDLNAQILSKDMDLAGKDAEIAELKRRLFKAQEKNESLEIDLAQRRLKRILPKKRARPPREARKISTSALNVAQTNYAEAQSIVDTRLDDSEWMQNNGVAYVANSILNATELDRDVAGLTDAAHAVGDRAGYLECTQHVETTLKQHFGTRHFSVTDQAEDMLVKAEEVYDNLSLPIIDLVTDALKHDDYVSRIKSIFEVLETIELSDEKEDTGGDGVE